MIGSAREQALRTFSDQFVTDGPRIVYRQNHRGAPIPVSPEECDRFVKAFDRSYRLLFWGFLIGATVVLLGLTGMSAASGTPLATGRVVVAIGAMVGLLTGSIWWTWNAPARALTGRMASGKPLSKAEARRRAFARMPYRNFIISAGAIGLLFFQVTGGRDFLAGWNLLWSVVAVLALVGVGVQAYRKWSGERSASNPQP